MILLKGVSPLHASIGSTHAAKKKRLVKVSTNNFGGLTAVSGRYCDNTPADTNAPHQMMERGVNRRRMDIVTPARNVEKVGGIDGRQHEQN